jgi:Ca2+-dependent lipid-binding protein
VNQARDLINTDKESLSDPYARFYLLPDRKKRTKRKTKIVKDSLTPHWDEEFDFDMSLHDAKLKTLELTVKNDKNFFSREKTFMGQCLIELEAINDLEVGHTEWYSLRDETFFDKLIKKLNS